VRGTPGGFVDDTCRHRFRHFRVFNPYSRDPVGPLICDPIGRTFVLSHFFDMETGYARARTAAARKEHRARESRLGIRVDGQTKKMVARAAELERRS